MQPLKCGRFGCILFSEEKPPFLLEGFHILEHFLYFVIRPILVVRKNLYL